ncbi:MAG: C2 family cysteine protease, partial [Bacteroidota bacterium]
IEDKRLGEYKAIEYFIGEFKKWMATYNFGDHALVNHRVRYMVREVKLLTERLGVLETQMDFSKLLAAFDTVNEKTKKEMLTDEQFIADFRENISLDVYLNRYHGLITHLAPKLKIFEVEDVVEDDQFDLHIIQITEATPLYFFESTKGGFKPYQRLLSLKTKKRESKMTIEDTVSKKIKKRKGDFIILDWKDEDLDGHEYYLAVKPGDQGLDMPTYEDHEIEEMTLFNASGMPSINDVRQSDIGDCWLLSAISAIVKNDPGHFKKIISDDPANRIVSVRLNVVNFTTHGRTFTPRVIRVRRTALKDTFNPDHGLWVKMIEKAWIAGKFNSYWQVARTRKRKAQNLVSGMSGYAMDVLLGRKSNYHAFYPDEMIALGKSSKSNAISGIDDNGNAHFVNLPWAPTVNRIAYSNPQKSMAFEILNDLGKVKKWREYVHGNYIKRLYQREINKRFDGEITFEDIKELFEGNYTDANGNKVIVPVLDPGVARLLLKYLDDNKLLAYRSGTGKYSKGQLGLFATIQHALDNDKIVTIGTKRKISRDKSIGTLDSYPQ